LPKSGRRGVLGGTALSGGLLPAIEVAAGLKLAEVWARLVEV